MLVGARENLAIYLEESFIKITNDTPLLEKIWDYAKDTYDIPIGITSDHLTLRTSIRDTSDFILFCLLDSLVKSSKDFNKKVEDYFTEQEIRTYSNGKFKVDKIKFPLRFKTIQVSDDQWIGTIDFEMLMKLRAAQLINYNENAQRTMKKIIRGDKEVYKITLNEAAVEAIKEMYLNNIYIPTVITLNIPAEIDNDFYYDDDNGELVIKSLKYFDIIDGYHRYIAACRAKVVKPDLNLKMELRISNFYIDKAKQFIYQEEQKTKMKTEDSNSYNQYNPSNKIIDRLNTNPQSNLQGLISLNEGIIDYGELSGLIQHFYFGRYIKKKDEKAIMFSVIKELTENFNMLTEYDMKYLEKPYSYRQLLIVMSVFDYYKEKDKKYMCEMIERVISKVNTLDEKNIKKISLKNSKNTAIKLIGQIIKEEEPYVP